MAELSVRFMSDMPFGIGFGGKEIQMLQYRDGLAARHPDIDAQLLDPWDRSALKGVQVLHLFGLSDAYKPLIATLRSKQPDVRVVISTTYYSTDRRLLPAAVIGRLLPLPNYFSVKRRLLGMADRLIVNSKSEAAQIEWLFGGDLRSRITLLPNAVEDDFATFRRSGDEDAFLAATGLAPGYFLSVGFLDDRKNSLAMVEAHLATHAETGRSLVLIGGNRYGDRRGAERMATLIAEHPGSIVHLPFVERGSDLMRSAYRHCSGHALVSHIETPGLANLEALVFGKPLLVGDCPPVREYFGEEAIYADPRSSASIERGFVELGRRAGNGQADDALVQRYRLSRVIDELAGLYRTLAG